MIDLPTNIDLDNSEFAKAYKILQNTDANVFITGKLNFLSTAKLRPKEAEPL